MYVRREPLVGALADLTALLAGDRAFIHPDFATLWSHKGGTPVVWVLERFDQPVAVLPGVEFGRWPLTRFQSMPDGGYGGILWQPNVARDQRCRLSESLLSAVAGHGYARIHIFDFYNSLPTVSGFDQQIHNTTLVAVSGADWTPPCRKLVSQVRKADREGIEVEPMNWLVHGDAFWELVRHTDRRHGQRRPFYPRRFYQDLAQLTERWGGLHWVVCRHEGHMACSHIYLVEGGVLQGWQILFNKAFSFLKSNQYIRLSICRSYASRGINFLNLGGTPANAPGLESYKKRWGGQVAEYQAWVRYGGLGHLLRLGAG